MPRLALLIFCLSVAAAAGFDLESAHPIDGADGVPVSASLHLRFSEALDLESLRHLRLQRVTEGGVPASEVAASEVAVGRASDLTNAAITLSPRDFLVPGTRYEIRGTGAVKSKSGEALVPFVVRFTTGSQEFAPDDRLVFEPETFDRTRSMTTVVFGPDRRLYAADAFGHLVVWDVGNDQRPHNRQTLLDDPTESRQYIDLEWDPEATAENLVLWVSYAERLAPEGDRHYFTGTIARLEIAVGAVGAGGVTERVVVAGLPHGRERQGGFETLPHQPNGLVFKDGMLYQSVGSTSSSGGPANWGVSEQALSACILEIDYARIDGTLDVHSGLGFDPSSQGSPVRVFATGVRNALEMVAHSNGRLYTAVNINDRKGPGDGVPDHPDIPGDQNKLVTGTTPDHESLYILERGRHYGFPNPVRGQFVLSGGNPTADVDPFEIPDYPVGTPPDEGFAPDLIFPLWQYGGTSPNGMLEYLPRVSHPLRHALICCFYSAGDIAVMTLGEDGLPVAVEKLRGQMGKLQLAGPLDITMDPESGTLYVADFGKQAEFGADGSMVMLRPALRPGAGR
ncbi:hypothetical protein BH23VER1_BH23VER1_32120 [soil metagenome]